MPPTHVVVAMAVYVVVVLVLVGALVGALLRGGSGSDRDGHL